MSTVDIVLLIAAAAGLPLVINIVFIVMALKSNSKKKRALTTATARMVETREAQESVLSQYFDKLGYEASEAGDEVEKLTQARFTLLTNLLEGVFYESEERLSDICDNMNEFISALVAYDVKATPPEEVVTGDSEATDEAEGESQNDKSDALQAELDEVKADNKRLKKEVHKTLKTLNNIFAEYSSMFGEEIDDTDLSAEEILKAMAAFAEKTEVQDDDEAPSGDVVVNEEAEVQVASDEEETTWADAFAESEPETSDAASAEASEAGADDEPNWEDAFSEENTKE